MVKCSIPARVEHEISQRAVFLSGHPSKRRGLKATATKKKTVPEATKEEIKNTKLNSGKGAFFINKQLTRQE
jgi:hypothetical protein